MKRGRSSSAIRVRRAAAPAKSPRRRSPEPGVVRSAAFVTPKPSGSSASCSAGATRRGVKPASWRSRQKSLRGFAKCAAAAAEKRPGLIPQKTTFRPGRKTSGTAEGVLRGGFGRSLGVAVVDPDLEQLAQRLAAQRREPRLPDHRPDDADGVVAVTVDPRVALLLREMPQPLHGRKVDAGPDGPDRAYTSVQLYAGFA